MWPRLKYLLFIIFSQTILPYQSFSQGNHYSHFNDNAFFSMPSTVWYHENSFIHLNYQNKWPGTNSFEKYGVAYFMPIDKLDSHIGVYAKQDNQNNGVFSRTNIGINYSYKVKMTRRLSIAGALQGNYAYSKVAISDLTFQNQETYADKGTNIIYFNAGATAILNDMHFLSISVENIMQDFDEYNFNFAYQGKYEIDKSDAFILAPWALISVNKHYQVLHYGSTMQYQNLIVGLGLMQHPNFDMLNTTILLGINYENMRFVYSYDIHLSGEPLAKPNMAAHEVTFLKEFMYKGRTRKRRAINCP